MRNRGLEARNEEVCLLECYMWLWPHIYLIRILTLLNKRSHPFKILCYTLCYPKLFGCLAYQCAECGKMFLFTVRGGGSSSLFYISSKSGFQDGFLPNASPKWTSYFSWVNTLNDTITNEPRGRNSHCTGPGDVSLASVNSVHLNGAINFGFFCLFYCLSLILLKCCFFPDMKFPVISIAFSNPCNPQGIAV